MSQCIKCGALLVGTAEAPPKGLCIYCDRDNLRQQLQEMKELLEYAHSKDSLKTKEINILVQENRRLNSDNEWLRRELALYESAR